MGTLIKQTSIFALAIFFIVAGILHFVKTSVYLDIMPLWIPYKLTLVYISGICEVLGGIGILIPRFRKLSGYWLIVLLIAVFPANIHMALHNHDFASIPAVLLWLRLPLQFLLIAWVWWSANEK